MSAGSLASSPMFGRLIETQPRSSRAVNTRSTGCRKVATAARCLTSRKSALIPKCFNRPMAQPGHERKADLPFVGRLGALQQARRIAVAAFGSSPLLQRHRLLIVGDGLEPRAPGKSRSRPWGSVLQDSKSSYSASVPNPGSRASSCDQPMSSSSRPSANRAGRLAPPRRWHQAWLSAVTSLRRPGEHPDRRVWNQNSPRQRRKTSPPDSKDKLEALATDKGAAVRDWDAAAAERISCSFTWDVEGQDDPRGPPLGAGPACAGTSPISMKSHANTMRMQRQQVT